MKSASKLYGGSSTESGPPWGLLGLAVVHALVGILCLLNVIEFVSDEARYALGSILIGISLVCFGIVISRGLQTWPCAK